MYAKIFGRRQIFIKKKFIPIQERIVFHRKIHLNLTIDTPHCHLLGSAVFRWINWDDTVAYPKHLLILRDNSASLCNRKYLAPWVEPAVLHWSLCGGSIGLPVTNTDPAARCTWGQSPREVRAPMPTSIKRNLSREVLKRASYSVHEA